jgi:acyl-CoA synthetase (AMP-forming)/AMP-acid ligase II
MSTYVDVLHARAESQPERPALTFLIGGDDANTTSLTYAAMLDRVKAIAVELSKNASPGDRAILLYPPGVEFYEAFLGCLFAGVIAVPMFPPTPSRLREAAPRLIEMFRSSAPRVVMTPSVLRSHAELLTMHYDQQELLRWVHNDTVDQRQSFRWRRPDGLDASSIAFLQYTSGSTGKPKGAMVTHGNLLANSKMILKAFELDEKDTVVHWLPAYHDMGLIGCGLAPLSGGGHIVFMSPWDFLTRPIRWLKAITRYRGTANAAPNFAFDLCVRRVSDADKATLDLSSWRAAMNGSEPINAGTLQRFADAFGGCGFKVSSYRPCYGLAEATLLVAGTAAGPEAAKIYVDREELAKNHVVPCSPDHPTAACLVASGRVVEEGTVVIVDPTTSQPLPESEVGEIWIRGPFVAMGYWRDHETTEETFRARLADGTGPFLRTGDLGFLRGDKLVVTGRIKDLIIWHGVNYYPQDIEATAEEVHGVRRGRTAAFGVPVGDEERVVIIVEFDRRHAQRTEPVPAERERRWNHEIPTGIMMIPSEAPPSVRGEETQPPPTSVLVNAIKEAVGGHHGLPVHDVVLVPPGAIPRTSSGKTKRRATRELYLKGELSTVASLLPPPPSSENPK